MTKNTKTGATHSASTHNKLLAKFHILLSKLPHSELAKEQILENYNLTSSRFLSNAQLIDECDALEKQVNPQLAELDKCRKRLMASIGGWLRTMNKHDNAHIIKGIACRASGKTNFNDIPLEQLRSLYYAFRNKTRDMRSVNELTAIELEYLQIAN